MMQEQVDLDKIRQFTTQTRGELLSSLIKPPEDVKNIVLPLCLLYDMPVDWSYVRSAMKKFQGGAGTALFQQFRDTLSQHEEQQQIQIQQQTHSSSSSSTSSTSSPAIVAYLREIMKHPNYSLSKLSKVSMAAASLVYLYQGLLVICLRVLKCPKVVRYLTFQSPLS